MVMVLRPASVTMAGALTRKALIVESAVGSEEVVASTFAPAVQALAV